MTFRVRWPDGDIDDCYSPSLVMHDYLTVGNLYRVTDFVELTTAALTQASDRVRAKFGFACTSAAATAAQITTKAGRFAADAQVQVISMSPSLPTTEPVS